MERSTDLFYIDCLALTESFLAPVQGSQNEMLILVSIVETKKKSRY
jgi:hypothetical protein